MLEFLYDWIWNFVCYMILLTALMQAMPENSYQKYIKFISGLILILILCTPVLRLFHLEETFQNRYEIAEYRRVQKEMERFSEYLEEKEESIWERESQN